MNAKPPDITILTVHDQKVVLDVDLARIYGVSTKRLNEQLKKIEEDIIQVKIKSGQDALNYPIKLNDKVASIIGVVSSADTKPTKQSYDVFNELSGKSLSYDHFALLDRAGAE